MKVHRVMGIEQRSQTRERSSIKVIGVDGKELSREKAEDFAQKCKLLENTKVHPDLLFCSMSTVTLNLYFQVLLMMNLSLKISGAKATFCLG